MPHLHDVELFAAQLMQLTLDELESVAWKAEKERDLPMLNSIRDEAEMRIVESEGSYTGNEGRLLTLMDAIDDVKTRWRKETR